LSVHGDRKNAEDRASQSVYDPDRLNAPCPESHAREGMHAGVRAREGIVVGQRGATDRVGEVDGASIVRGDVAVGVHRRDRKPKAVPAAMLEGPLMLKWVAAAGLTWMNNCPPPTMGVVVSVA